jgi:hypothetical protein
MNPTNKIYNAGNRGLVGSALMRRLTNPPSPASGGGAGGEGSYANLLTRTHAELDHTNQAAAKAFGGTGRRGNQRTLMHKQALPVIPAYAGLSPHRGGNQPNQARTPA